MASLPKVLIYATHSAPAYAEALRRLGSPAQLLVAQDPDEARRLAPQADVLFSWRFPQDSYALANRLRWVQSMGAGVEDIVAAEGLRRDVLVTRVVDQFGGMIAEYVFSELLARVRQHERLRAQQAENRWQHIEVGTLEGSRIGIAGLGSIGREIARKARTFDMEVYGLTRTGESNVEVDRLFGPEGWSDFVRDLDVLVLALPLTADTRDVVGEQVLAAMRPTSVLVNVGRGATVDQEALVRAVQAGELGGAILDVFREEPLPEHSPLWSLPGVIVTPHVSGPSIADRVAGFFHENLERFNAGKALKGLVDRRAGY